MHTIGRLDPSDKRTAGVVKTISALIRAMPAHRIFAPDPDTLAKAALMAGLMCRLLSYAEDKRMKALHDCILFLQAQKGGFVLLSRNIVDFDYMLQLWPEGRILMYRQR
ncbi:DNA-binding protein [Beijerinckia sp. L45]|uniref:DNA-binding protein n=1 Tax=Beijerinckia sp. L45 TaxID=1641855 RepID=UPI0034CE96DB